MSRMKGHATVFNCLNCRLAQRAHVRAHAVAVPQTTHHANTTIAMLLALKRCPRCGYFDRGVAKHNKHNLRFALSALGMLFAVIAGSLFIIAAIPKLGAASAAIALALIYVLVARSLLVKYPISVERRVILMESTVPVHDGWY
jgi:hypothetical protein